MNYHDTEGLTVEAVSAYYNNDRSVFLGYLHPKAMVLSISEGQLIEGKDRIVESFQQIKKPSLLYELSGISCMARRIEANSCYVLLDCHIRGTFPNGETESVNQRISVVWKYIKEKYTKKEAVLKEGWYALHVHISVAQKVKKELEYLPHFSESLLAERELQKQEDRIALRDVDACVHYVTKKQLVRMETQNRQVVATLNNGSNIRMNQKLSALEKELGERYVRISRTCLVNVDYVVKIKNYQLFLQDQSVIRIPRDRYALVKSEIQNLLS